MLSTASVNERGSSREEEVCTPIAAPESPESAQFSASPLSWLASHRLQTEKLLARIRDGVGVPEDKPLVEDMAKKTGGEE